jgi:dTMP kinase
MYKKKFYFIVFEGVEGTGKSFQINKLYRSLKKKNFSVIKTREPGGSKSAEKIRNLIFEKNSVKLDKKTDFYLMLAARNEHIKNTIDFAKKKKMIILCDRFTDSTYAYQVIGSNIDSHINEINKRYILNNLKPHLTIVLKSNIKTIFKRIKKRKIKNKFDKLKKNFYIKAQNCFINLAKNKKNK